MANTDSILKGKKGIIFGALNDKSIAWKVAEKAFDAGAEFTLSNAPVALRFGEIDKLADNAKSLPRWRVFEHGNEPACHDTV